MYDIVPEPGVYFGVPFPEYQSWKAYNPSLIKVGLEHSWKAMRHTMLNGSDSSDEMDIGKATHHAVFEPKFFEAKYKIWEGAKKQGKAWDAFAAEHEPQNILTASQFAECIAIRDAVRAHRAANELLTAPAHAEVSIVWVDNATGALCKGRIDWLPGGVILDLKTTKDVRAFSFIRQVVNYGWHISLGAYVDGLAQHGVSIDRVVLLAADKTPWHDVAVYDLAPQAIRKGLEKWQYGLSRALECERLKRWPGYAPEPMELNLPDWAAEQDTPEPVTIGGMGAFEE